MVCQINSIPKDVLGVILTTYFNPKEIANLKLVCKLFRNVIVKQEDYLKKEFPLPKDQTPLQGLQTIIDRLDYTRLYPLRLKRQNCNPNFQRFKREPSATTLSCNKISTLIGATKQKMELNWVSLRKIAQEAPKHFDGQPLKIILDKLPDPGSSPLICQ